MTGNRKKNLLQKTRGLTPVLWCPVLLLLLSLNASASYLIKGVGGITCERYIENYRRAGTARREQRSWVLGFISGMNFMDRKIQNRGVDIHAELIDDWILNYCEEHPSEKLHTAVEQFARELEK